MKEGGWHILIGIVMIAIAFIMFPIILTGADRILHATNVSSFTGLTDVAAIAPLVVFVGLLFGGSFTLYQGVGRRRGGGSRRGSY